MEKWITTWGMAHCNIKNFSPSYKDGTMRLAVFNNIEGSAVRLRFCNKEGKKPYQLRRVLVNGKPVAFQGRQEMEIPPGKEVCSDAIRMPVRAGEYLTISAAFGGKVISGNSISATVQCSPKGDYSQEVQFVSRQPGLNARIFHIEKPIGGITGIDVLSDNDDAGAVVCFGDSITQQSQWTEPLSRWMAEKYPGKISLVNMGIGGNRLLYGPMKLLGTMHGEAGRERFAKDVLEVSGVSTVILAIGTNDLGFFYDEKNKEFVRARQLTEEFPKLIRLCRERGVKVFGSTLLPRCGAGNFRENQEKERQKLNDWIRTCDLFDGVFDFDLAVRDQDHPEIMNFFCDSGDHLHPSAQGGMQMMRCIVQTLDEKKWELI